jgi:HK97 family phage prohead protease
MTQGKENIKMEMKRATIPFNIKQADVNNDMGLFEGYGSMFGNIDFGGDIVEGGAFRKSLAEWSEKGQLPQLLGFHKNSNVIGDWLEMREDEKGLYVKGQLWVKGDKRIEQAVVAHNIMRGTGPKGLSIGYSVKDSELEEFQGGTVRRLKEVELFEVSVVGYAMNPKADVTAVKSMTDADGRLLSKREVEKILRESGLSKRQSQAFIAKGYEGIERDAKTNLDLDESDSHSDLSGLAQSLKNLSTTLKG